jgi:hypothetical protein
MSRTREARPGTQTAANLERAPPAPQRITEELLRMMIKLEV